MKTWQCPHCYTLIPDGATICIGCRGRVTYKKSRQVGRASVLSLLGAIGFSFGVFFGVLGVIFGYLLGYNLPISEEPTVSPPTNNGY